MHLQNRNLTIHLQGEDVKLLQSELTQLGYSIAKEETNAGLFDKTTQEAVLDFQKKHNLPTTGEVDAATAKKINEAVDSLQQNSSFVVRGQVRQTDSKPVPSVKVVAFDRDMRYEEFLADAVTDATGYYEIKYTQQQFRRAEKENADLLIRVYKEDAKPVASSPTVFNARGEEVIDITIEEPTGQQLSEYERFMADITPLIENVPLTALTAEDISFLSQETAISFQFIQFLSTAAKLQLQAKLPAEIFYGFARENLPLDLPFLTTQPVSVLQEALRTALRDHIIPGHFADELEKTLQQLTGLAAPQPVFLLKPELLFSNLLNGHQTGKEATAYISGKLNRQLQKEVLDAIGPVSPALSNALQVQVSNMDYQKSKDITLAAIVTETILPRIKQDSSLAKEVIEIADRLTAAPSKTVSEALGLHVALKENPLFSDDIRRARTFEYARVAQLNDDTTRKLAAKNIPLDDAGEPLLSSYVQEGIIDEQQKSRLQFAINLGRLTGDNTPFMDALQNEKLPSASELTHWEKADWQDIITREKIALPPGNTAETYAATIVANLENTFPSQFLLNRILATEQTARVNLLDTVNGLLADNDKLIEDGKIAPINWKDRSEKERAQLQSDLQQLTGLANTYRHLGITALINDKSLDLAQKKTAVNNRIQLLGTFYANNPNIDLRYTDFFDTKADPLNWKNIPEADKPLLTQQLMAHQRLLNLTEDPATSQVVLSNGYDAAVAIAGVTEDEFLKTSGLALGAARLLYARSQERTAGIDQFVAGIRDIAQDARTTIAMGNNSPALINALKTMDGYSSFFGSQDYCDCGECRSVLSPAAYFADLMYFIEEQISKPVFVSNPRFRSQLNHPLYLKNRRPDLWKLPLTCENTKTLVPYLTIVNEVLENYLNTIVRADIYEKLSSAAEKISFSLPFNLPMQELELYLGHFGLTLARIYRLLKQSDEKVSRAGIHVSKAEWEGVLSGPDLPGARLRFGNRASYADFPVQDFIQIAKISRSQLDQLLASTFHPDLRNITITKKREPDELQNFQEVINNLNDSRLDVIHRFIRLWQKTPWTIPELDLVLSSLQSAYPADPASDRTTIVRIAQLVEIQDQLQVTVEELCAFIYQFPVSGSFPQPPAKEADKKLFERLFDTKKLFEDSSTHALVPVIYFYHYFFEERDRDHYFVDPKTPLLLAGTGISETELLLLFKLLKPDIEFKDSGYTILNLRNISLLYRHARLAKALQVSIADFIDILYLIFPVDQAAVKTIEQIRKLVSFKTWLHSTPFSVAELCFILQGREGNGVRFQLNEEKITAILNSLQLLGTPVVNDLLLLLAQSYNITGHHLKNSLQWVGTSINVTDTGTALLHDHDFNTLQQLVWALERVLLLWNKLQLKEETVAFLTQHAYLLGITNPKNITLQNLQSLAVYQSLIRESEAAEQVIQTALVNYQSDHSLSGDNMKKLADLWQQEPSLINSLVQALTLPATPLEAIEYIHSCLGVCETLGVNGFSLQKLALDNQYGELVAARDVAYGAFASKYGDEPVRREKLEPYTDKVNILKRDALCDYILACRRELKFTNWHDIYAFFLLDVDMSGCFRTSRLVCAISSLQLYIHRCLVNLEQANEATLLPDRDEYVYVKVDPSLVPAQQWEWRKNYRVWEANRKVFLYPENYLEPDLRDNKSSLFKELEDELLQQKITLGSAEAAYKKYISGFAELSHLRITGSYYHDATKTYYFFGRTQQDPPQYYYRTWVDNKVWTPWQKMELAIPADSVSAIIYLGKLYLFWVEITTREKTVVQSGESKLLFYYHDINVAYSYLNEQKKWIVPQKMELKKNTIISGTPDDYFFYPDKRTLSMDNASKDYFERSRAYKKINLAIIWDVLVIDYLFDYIEFYKTEPRSYGSKQRHFIGKINFYTNRIIDLGISSIFGLPYLYHITLYKSSDMGCLGLDLKGGKPESEVERYSTKDTIPVSITAVSSYFNWTSLQPNVNIIHHRSQDAILTLSNQQYLLQQNENLSLPSDPTRVSVRLTTSIADLLGEKLFTQGLEKFLSLETQSTTERPIEISLTNTHELFPPVENREHIDFGGTYGDYYRELFFHTPFLIANHLNANQKFKEAKWWYERIFDPTASEPSDDAFPNDRNWRYIDFRRVTIQKMKETLSDESAIERYKKDPFNPHAIARLRTGAYQKAIVMKYIDNLLDWGDDLFAQDTMESINEATMLYVLASDILGKRPQKLGKCETANDEDLTYERIGPAIRRHSEFLVILENIQWLNSISIKQAVYAKANPVNQFDQAASGKQVPNVLKYEEITRKNENKKIQTKLWETKAYNKYPSTHLIKQSILVFCVPENQTLLQYWDRVEDRLFKIHHCMNISGMRRQLALFQPPIDPMMLVRARAAGLTLEDVLGNGNGSIPAYRFTYLIEKAKQYAQTVQSFGAALLNALEKRDIEELTLLRTVHERNILTMTKEIKKRQIQEAQYQYQGVVESKLNVQNRVNYYQGLIHAGLTNWETTQQISKHTASVLQIGDGILRLYAGISYLIPQIGSPFAMKYGGKEIGDSATAFAQIVASAVKVAEAVSASAGLEASFQRRQEEWKQQLLLAQRELVQAEQQRLAADIRVQIATKDGEIHEKNREQAEELHEFYKNKFTNLGLFNYQSTTLNRLYREAYHMAYDMALMAQNSYGFETDDNSPYIAADNWQFDRAGLLAGERLLLQLQRLEKAYLDNHTRDAEVTQSFSLALLDPASLIALKQLGSCDFSIPEYAFDLFYPGQFKRIIKSVRITIPCVTGPYTNVGAKLSLESSRVRKNPSLSGDLIPINNLSNTKIATSNAQNDAGMFDFNFRDERYLPFEGAGAISSWKLTLPATLRPFNYDTIADVIIHISYTAKEDRDFRTVVENQIVSEVTNYARSNSLFRLFNIKQEFGNEWHTYFHQPRASGLQPLRINMAKERFPYMFQQKTISVNSMDAYITVKPGATVAERALVQGLKLRLAQKHFEGVFHPAGNEFLFKATLQAEPDHSASFDILSETLAFGLLRGSDPILPPIESIADFYLVFHYYIGS